MVIYTINSLERLQNIENKDSVESLVIQYNIGEKIAILNKFSNLKDLSLSGTKITNLNGLNRFPNLTSLDLSGTQITNLDGLNRFPNLSTLDLSRSQITSLESTGDLPHLTKLNLSGTKITNLNGLNRLPNLSFLILSNTQITSLEGIGTLSKLSILDLSRTKTTNSEGLEELSNLTTLDLSFSTIDKIPYCLAKDCFFALEAEPLKIHPSIRRIELYNATIIKQPFSLFFQSSDLIQSYYESAKIVPHETKVLFLGFGGTGKTHTIKRILNGNEEFEDDGATKGIKICLHKNSAGDVLNIWDFGGQDILHSMHRCFLSNNCCYVIVVGNRQENSYPDLMRQARYWLNNIRSYAKNSPVLLALNCWEGLYSDGLDTRVLREEFPELNIDYISYQAKGTNEALPFASFEKALYKAVKTSSGYALEFPKSWHAIMSNLIIMDEDYISLTDYLNICKEQMESEGEQYDEDICLWLLKWFDELGVCFSYYNREGQKERQEEYKVFKPKWLTEAVYKIIDYKNEKSKYENGIIPFDSILRCLSDVLEEHEVSYILKLMEKFQFATAIDPKDQESDYFIPALCNEVAPKDFSQSIQNKPLRSELLIQYRFTPEYIMQQLMIRIYKAHQRLPFIHYARGFIYKTDTGADTLVCAIDYENQPSIVVETYCNEENKTYGFTQLIINTIEEINSEIKVSSPIYFIKRKEGQTAKISVGAIETAKEMGKSSIGYPGVFSYFEFDLRVLLDDYSSVIQRNEDVNTSDVTKHYIYNAKNLVVYGEGSKHYGSTIVGDDSSSNDNYIIRQEET